MMVSLPLPKSHQKNWKRLAVDFDYQDGQPFEHYWQTFRTRKDRSLPTVSNHEYDKYPKKGKYTTCVKVVDIFGCDTSITVEVEI